MQKSEAIGQLADALAKAQGKYKPIVKNCINPFYKSKYADLSAIIDATKDALSNNGLSVIQTNEISENGKLIVTTTLMHSSGEWVSGTLSMAPVKNDPQGQGSCLTYIRRYSLQQILMVAAEDEDDGNAASEQQERKKELPPERVLLTFEQLVEKMQNSVNVFELTNRAKKYKADFEALPKDEQEKVKEAKAIRKTELENAKV